MPRRQHITLLTITALAAFLLFSFLAFRGDSSAGRDASYGSTYKGQVTVDQGILHGEAKAEKIENATLKAELGHAAWKVLHTMMAKFPDEPTEDDSTALRSYIHLFARLYPCGDCARHFQKILKKYPPQVATRSTAAAWACHVHNEVNKRLKKELFDCSNIGDFYDCGCAGDDPKDKKGAEAAKEGKGIDSSAMSKKDGFRQLELEKEGLTRGG